MKKICLILAVCFTVLTCGNFAFASGTQDEDTRNAVVSGSISEEDKGGGYVTILLKNDEGIGHIGQTKVKDDNTYFYKFKLEDDIGDYTLSVKAGNNDVTNKVGTAYAYDEKMKTSIAFVTDSAKRYFKVGDVVELRADIINLYEDNVSYKLYFCSYNEDGALVDVKVSEEQEVVFDKDGNIQNPSLNENLTISDDTAIIKAFIWKTGDTEMQPIAKCKIQKTGDITFQDGDKVVFIGDSITHIGKWQYFLEHYYQTRYPDRNIEFLPKGITGDRYSGALDRLDWDIFADGGDRATVMMGFNDLANSNFDKNAAICIENAEKLIEECISRNIELTIVTPPLHDERDIDFFNSNSEVSGKNDALTALSTELKTLADKYELNVYDINTLTNSITVKNTGTDSVIQSEDRTHPTNTGYMIMAYGYIKAMEQDKVKPVAEVEISVDDKTKTTDNCDISDLQITENGVSYKYSPKASPFAASEEYKKAEALVATLTNEINREIIKITGLESGEYSITFNGSEASKTYSDTELATGINIATLTENPNQQRAKKALALLFPKGETKRSYVSKLRGIATTIHYNNIDFGGKYDLDDPTEYQAFLNAQSKSAYINDYKNYKTDAPNKSEYEEKIRTITAEAKALSVPISYKVTITKVQ